MPTIESYTTQVAAGGTSDDMLIGKKLGRPSSRGIFRILGRHATAQGTLVLDVWRGNDQVGDSIPMQAAAGGPNLLEDILCEFAVFGTEGVIAKLRETGGATATDPVIKFELHPR